MSFPLLLNISLIVVVLLFSVVIHEIAHGYVAWLNGDPTARLSGRITLNPIPHIDPIGTILLPLLIIGLPILLGQPTGPIIAYARPVPVNPSYFRNYRMGEVTTSLAGSVSNLALAVVFTFIAKSGLLGLGLLKMAAYGASINIFLAIFNLLPIPPLDGSHVVGVFLPYRLLQYYRYLEPFGLLIIIILLFTGILGIIIWPIYLLISSFLQVPVVF